MKRKALFVAFLFCFFVSIAQKKVLVQGIYPNIFIQHKVVSGETLYSIGKLYHFTAAQLSQQNGLNENAMLAIDKVMKINLTPQNFTQDGQSAESESLVPIHHIVQKGENLYRISQTYGKIRIDFLREWNDLNNDVIQQGQKIVIGHLKVDKQKTAEVVDRTTTAEEESTQGYGVNETSKPGTTKTTQNTRRTNTCCCNQWYR